MEVKDFTSSTSFLKKQIENIKSTIGKVKQISSNVRHRGVERVNKVACFDVEIKHTNEYMIDLGSEYKAQVTAQQALKILELRLQNSNDKLAKNQSAKSQAVEKSKKIQKVGKENVVKLQDGKSSMLQVIGNENGEDIFNIVEFQPQQKPNQSFNFVQKPAQNTIQQKAVQDNNRVKQEDLYVDDQQIEQEEVEAVQDDYEAEDGQEPDFMEQVRNRQVVAEQEKPVVKTNLPTIVQESREEQKPVVAEKVVKETKEPKEKKKVVVQKEKQVQKEPLPVKISKFKLQKMKERLQKQVE